MRKSASKCKFSSVLCLEPILAGGAARRGLRRLRRRPAGPGGPRRPRRDGGAGGGAWCGPAAQAAEDVVHGERGVRLARSFSLSREMR